MYSKNDVSSNDPWRSFDSGVTQYYQYAITGTALNDVFSVGSFGEILHFNGVTWTSYRDQTGLAAGAFRSVRAKGHVVVAAGYESARGIVARGTRVEP